MKKMVFIVEHSYEIDGDTQTKFIGVYSSLQLAKQAVERLRKENGFKNYPEGFEINEIEVDRDGWVDGFSTVTSIMVQSKKGEWEAVMADVLANGNYRILENVYHDDSDLVFRGNDIVKCEKRMYNGAVELFAVELAP